MMATKTEKEIDMSEFFEAHLIKCRYCGKYFASCEGPECYCLEEWEGDNDEWEGFNDEKGGETCK